MSSSPLDSVVDRIIKHPLFDPEGACPDAELREEASGLAREILEGVEGHFEQRHQNAQVRVMRDTGFCPCCGSEYR